MMNFRNLILSILLFVALNASAQISPSQYQKIDSLFIEWNRPNHPGGVIGIAQNGKTLFSKAYGLASLEYLVPNSTETRFNIASVSKQFTAMGIVLLDIQGKLSVDDNIRKYLPELPEFEEPITIRHLLHHTSGLRSLHAMLGLAGWRADDSRTNEDLYRFMENQRDLNFKPGDEYLYCNTGYMLMAKIIETITGEEFTEWMKKSVFEPLEMIHTYVEKNYSRIVPDNATSYSGTPKNGFNRAVEYWGYVGSGNIHSTSNDLLKWLTNFFDPQPGWEAPFKMMLELDKLNNGEDNNYAFGVVLDDLDEEKRIQHGGSIGGFRSFVCTYPGQKLNVVVLTNFSSSSSSQKADQVSRILLKTVANENTAAQETEKLLETVTLSNDILQKYVASYWNAKEYSVRKIYLKDDTLRYYRSEDNESPLIPIGNNEFQMLGVEQDLKVKFNPGENGDKTMSVTVDNGPPVVSVAFEPVVPSAEIMSSYAGRFYSPELETSYTISVEDEKLTCHHPRHGEFEMKILKEDILEGQWPFGIVKYDRDKKGIVNGIFVSNGRVRNLWFEKQE